VWQLRRQLYNLCRRLRPSILHSRALSGLDAIFPAKLAGVQHYVHSEHGWDISDLRGTNWKHKVLRRLHSPVVDRYVAVSSDLKRYLTEDVGVPDSKVIQISNGVDTEQFSPAFARPIELLPVSFGDPCSIIIGTIGRIQRIKDHETLMRAFALLSRANCANADRLRLAIIGNGPLFGELHRLRDELGIAHLTWLPGAVSNVPDVMKALDIFVLPSLGEGISNTILEAMATGIPVVATAVGGNVELVSEGETGRLFQPGDVQSLARFLTEYVADPSLRQRHAHRAREVAVQRFALKIMVEKYQALYEELCQKESTKSLLSGSGRV
jgi:sugar transferase (PEP-CTERM/EpsH1 system associated)